MKIIQLSTTQRVLQPEARLVDEVLMELELSNSIDLATSIINPTIQEEI